MSSLPTRFCKIASLKCKPKWDFLSKLRKDKKKGKQVVFPYENASFASIFYPFLPRLCCHNKYRLTKADSTIESPPSQSKCNKKHYLITKKQATLVCFLFISSARCILISYSVNLISRHTNRTSNLTDRILFAV